MICSEALIKDHHNAREVTVPINVVGTSQLRENVGELGGFQ